MKFLLTSFLLLSFFFCKGQPLDTLTNAEKVYGLSTLWSEAKYNFANFRQSPSAWDSLYKIYIPKILAAKSIREYYKCLTTFYVSLEDGHTNVYDPPGISKLMAIPPFRTRLTEGKLIVTRVWNDTLQTAGIVPGIEVMEIDGMSAVEYGEKFIMPYVSASTVQSKINMTYNQNLFLGERVKPLMIKIKTSNGSIKEVSVKRFMTYKPMGPNIIFTVQKNGIANLKIDSFGSHNFKQIIDSLYPVILKSSALIIDLRSNGGGDSSQGEYLLAHLTHKPFLNSKWQARQHTPSFVFNENITWVGGVAEQIEPLKDIEIYNGQVVVLIGERTFSAAEDFLVAFDNSKRGIKVGLPTSGSTGQPIFFDLPGGGSARICAKKDSYPDGKEFVGKGIFPDVTVEITVKDLQEGKDAALEKALDIIQRKL